MRVHLVTLGCPKNLVDSEAALHLLRDSGCTAVDDPADADLLVVNACSFLSSAWRETVEEVERLAAHKNGGDKRLVLMGCLPNHHGVDLGAVLPDVDHFLPAGGHGRLPALMDSWRRGPGGERNVAGDGGGPFAGYEGRNLLTPAHTAFVKVAEGCNRDCAFCAIPAIRGRQVTRPVRAVVSEVETMVTRGVREVTLLSQDIVSYRHGRDRLSDLVDAIADTGVEWIRIMYVHPAGLKVSRLARWFAAGPVVPYLELPVQHASDRMLERMKRSYRRAHVEMLLREARMCYPDIVIRSEVIVGFPGEREQDFDELKDFVEDLQFDSLGVFPYSPEPGTKAVSMADAVDPATIRDRAEELSTLQESVSFSARSRFVGRTLRVLVDREVEAAELEGHGYAGRFYGQALEVDGEVYIAGENLAVGDFADVRITDGAAFDLAGVHVPLSTTPVRRRHVAESFEA